MEQLCHPPQVRRLAHEAGAVDAGRGRGLPQGVAAEQGVDALVRVDPQEFTRQFHRQHLAVVRRRPGAAAPQAAQVQRFALRAHKVEQVQQVVIERHGLLREMGVATPSHEEASC